MLIGEFQLHMELLVAVICIEARWVTNEFVVGVQRFHRQQGQLRRVVIKGAR